MDVKLAISIYAAVISTIVFIWRLYEFYYDKKSKLSVRISLNTKIPVSKNLEFNSSYMCLTTTIINVGRPKRMIEQPTFMSDKKVENEKHFNFISFSNVVNYPIPLNSGEKHVYEVTNDVIEDLKSEGVTKIKAIVSDTHGKNHYSQWYKL